MAGREKIILLRASGVILLAVVLAVPGLARRSSASVQPQQNRAVGDVDAIEVLPLRNGVHLIAGAGGNIVVQLGEAGVLLVDSGAEAVSQEILDIIRSLSDGPIRYVINTNSDRSHTGGNELLSLAGANESVNGPGNSGLQIENAPVIAREETYLRMAGAAGRVEPRPFDAWPTSTFFTPKKTMFFNDDGIEVLHQPSAYTDGDLIVFFRRSDIVVAGDVFVTEGYPVIDLERGGSIQGLIDAANRIIDITIPRFNQQGGTLVVPGHGRISNESEVVEYRDMLTIIRDRVSVMIDEGLTLAEVQAARPTLDYDGVHGATEGPWTTDRFVEAIYRSLQP